MPHPMLHLQHLSFTHPGAASPTFHQSSLTLTPGWTGLVGPNGSGKTTFLRLACGELHPDEGKVQAPCGAHLCPQRTDHPPELLAALLASHEPQAWRWRLKLGVEEDWIQRWSTLSHGERKRAQLAVALWLHPPLLAVDEPTNHLDEDTRQLIGDALAAYRGLGLLVSHDRALLERLCQQCLFFGPEGPVLRPGGYEAGSRERDREQTHLRRQREKADRALQHLHQEQTARRDQARSQEAARSKRGLLPGDHDARARIDRARVSDGGSGQRLRQLEGRLIQAQATREALHLPRTHVLGIRIPGTPAPRKHLLSLPEVQLALGLGRVLRIPALTLDPQDRVALTGPNGSGKTTLIRHLMASHTLPPDRVAYLPQEVDRVQAQALLASILTLSPDRLGRAMTLVRRLGSDPAQLLQSQDPSPGEVRKLLLARCLDQEPHLLILDEPTNHLDLPSLECLESALAECRAALLLVSHDPDFRDRLCTRQWRLAVAPDGCVELGERVLGADLARSLPHSPGLDSP